MCILIIPSTCEYSLFRLKYGIVKHRAVSSLLMPDIRFVPYVPIIFISQSYFLGYITEGNVDIDADNVLLILLLFVQIPLSTLICATLKHAQLTIRFKWMQGKVYLLAILRL